ncbi:MAG: GNAT family N-acetyltransferase [Deltaproteobacteria bacterium]|nr:GNAT family N-acetyltransferase [Deltaproteobacteria bacterium]
MPIREAKPTEIPDILEIWEISVRGSHSFLNEDDIIFIRDQLKEILPGHRGLFVWEENSLLRGFMGLSANRDDEESVLYVDMLFVLPECQNKGIGTAFLNYAKNRSTRVFLEVNPDNSSAVKFYESRGFGFFRRNPDDHPFGLPYPVNVYSWEKDSSR